MKAMILAAGLGTRLRPLTDQRPKALVEIGGKTLLEINIRRLKEAGFKELIINVHHHAQQIMDFVEKNKAFGLRIAFSVEKQLLDTGGGVKKARWFFEDCDAFLVHNVDVLTDMDYTNLFENLKETRALACLAVRQRDTQRYLLFDDRLVLGGWQNIRSGEKRIMVEHNRPLKPYSFMGVQVLSSAIFDFFPAETKFSLIEAYLQLAAQKQKVCAVIEQQARWLDVGKKGSLLEAELLFADWLKK
ncbi:nucleotidyltransferase family protein [Caldithrix abyssi]